MCYRDYYHRRLMEIRFSGNSEVNSSELLDNLEEMLPWYYIYMDNDVISRLKSSITNVCVTSWEMVKISAF